MNTPRVLILSLAFVLISWKPAPERVTRPAGAFPEPRYPAAPLCEDAMLTSHPALLIVAPHPDDEVLGFAGLADAYLQQRKPVKVVITTDGDAYCEACRFWKNSTAAGPTCNATDLSNFASPEIDSFAEIRRTESAAAAKILGLPAPTFLGYPDTGLAGAWRNAQAGEFGKRLRRSDFAACKSCEECDGGYGQGPETTLTAKTLVDSLREHIAAMPPGTLIATTHWLDSHGDHSGLGNLVRTLNQDPASGFPSHPVAYAVIHAHGPKEQTDCTYPAPVSPDCPCMDEKLALADPHRVSRIAAFRIRPSWPAALPTDIGDYGKPTHLCLPERLYVGNDSPKRRAVLSYASQLGTLARTGEHPAALTGIMDCSGYLQSFVRSTEVFVLEPAPTRGQASSILTTAYSPSDDAAVLKAFQGLRVADVSDGLDAIGLQDVGLVDPEIHALWRDTEKFTHRFVGIAVTARYVPTMRRPTRMSGEAFSEWEGLWYEHISPEPFVEHLRAGSVIVIDAESDGDTGSIGSYNILAWKLKGAVGVVTSGGARDTDEVIRQKVPLYLRRLGRGIRPGRNEIESVQRPVTIGGVLVRPGDVVVGDGDGVVVVPREHALEVARVARRVLDGDKEGRRDLYRQAGLPPDPSVQ
jgi:4-hydroxy-4-methyl-2-oxoglutarate aldolase